MFTNLSSSNVADPGYGTHNVCTGQCWYDNFVYTPAGHPDIVYVGGSYAYGEHFSNKRGVVLSTDAGVTSTDMTMDATDFLHPNALHPDQHALVTHPNNPLQFFEVNDGGVMRSSGEFADASAFCDARTAFVTLTAPQLDRCRQLLSRVPTESHRRLRGRGRTGHQRFADPVTAVTFVRLDSLAANDPNRFVSVIHVDPANPNCAWISYSGFNATTSATPGHVFLVTYNPLANSATWTDLSYDFGDIPATDVAVDDARGDVYAATDYGVFLLASGSTAWVSAAPGMPNVEVAGLTIVPSARKLYAATHGLSAWLLNLP